MNNKEIEISKTLLELLKDYSEDFENNDKEEILRKVNSIAEIKTDVDELDNYWRSRDLEDFCNDLATQRIKPNQLNEGEINEVILLIIDSLKLEEMCKLDYYLWKYTDAIEHHYDKINMLSDMIFWSDEYDTADKLIKGLQGSASKIKIKTEFYRS